MEEISLREIIDVLLKRKWIIVGITVLAVLISGFFSFFVLKPVYEAEAVLNIRGGDSPNVDISELNLGSLLEQLSQLPLYDIETYSHRILSYPFLEGVINNLDLDKEGYEPLSLQKAISIEQIPNTSLMRITVRDGDPHLAADIVNEVADFFILEVNKHNLERIAFTSTYLEEQLQEKEEELDLVMEEYRTFLEGPESVEELQAEIDSKITAIMGNKLELEYLQVNLAAAEAERDILEQELSTTAELIITSKSIADDPLLLRAYEEAEALSLEELGGLLMESEEPNPVYFELLSSLKNKNVEIESTKKRIAGTSASLEKLQRDLERLRVLCMDKEAEKERLDRELNYYKSTIEALEQNHLELQMVASLSAEEVNFNVISPAHAPQGPVQPRKMLNMAIAGVLGIMISVFLVFFMHYWETSEDKKSGELPGGI